MSQELDLETPNGTNGEVPSVVSVLEEKANGL